MLAFALALATSAHAEDGAADTDAASRKFLAGYLQVAPLRITTVTTNGYGAVTNANSVDLWTVYKGQNTLMTAKEVATLANDTDALELMKKQTTTGLAVGIPLMVAGVGVLGYGYYQYSEKPIQNMGWLIGGSAGGGVLIGVGYVVAATPAAKQKWPKNYYSEEEATEIVDTYNEARLKELGISKDDVLRYLKSRTEAPHLEVQPFFAGNSVGVTGTF